MIEASAPFRTRAAVPERWPDLVELFGERGACGGCWCMHWRSPAAEYESGKGEVNRQRLRDRVEDRERPAPGLLAYDREDRPVGWCSLGPRDEFVRMERSRILAPVDDRDVWSVVCFYVAPGRRRRGLSTFLLEGAVRFARSHEASILEGYPVDRPDGDVPPVFVYTGLMQAFEKVGFREVERRSSTRPIMRLAL